MDHSTRRSPARKGADKTRPAKTRPAKTRLGEWRPEPCAVFGKLLDRFSFVPVTQVASIGNSSSSGNRVNHACYRKGPPGGVKSGFTLTELLVASLVLALLAALALSAVVTAREAARRAVCASNLHRIGVALADYEDRYAECPYRHLELTCPSADPWLRTGRYLLRNLPRTRPEILEKYQRPSHEIVVMVEHLTCHFDQSLALYLDGSVDYDNGVYVP